MGGRLFNEFCHLFSNFLGKMLVISRKMCIFATR